ncbi:MAG: ferredoxin--NADP reductase [Halopseudomonas sp.]
MAQWQAGVVQENIAWTPALHSLRIKTGPIGFVAGQYTRLGLEIDDTLIARPYSFVNPPGASLLEFYFNAVPSGPLSNRLLALQPGDTIEVASPPSGFLVLDEVPQSRDLWLLATGTAIGPYLSILATPQPWQRFERIVLVYAVRYQQELSYRALLDQFVSGHPQQFAWLAFVSGESMEGAFSGRIPSAISNGRLEQYFGLPLTPEDSQVMICGNPEMVKDSMRVLKARGLQKNLRRSPGQISVERYW